MRHPAFAASLVSAVCLLTGCGESQTRTTLRSGRAVSFSTARLSHEWRETTDTLTVRLGRRTVVIKPAGVEVDGATVAAIPETTKSVTISDRAGRLVVTADGAAVYDAKFQR